MKIEQVDSLDLIKENYRDFSKYIIEQRVYPSVLDGCKPVHRRCLWASYKDCPRTLAKLPSHTGAVTKIHPHGAPTGTIVRMGSEYATPFPVYDTRGNWGDEENPASADRYLECNLSQIAVDIYMEFLDSAEWGSPEFAYEPLALPAYLPFAFLQGAKGIGSGTPSVSIPPLSAKDMINYYIEYLETGKHSYKAIKPSLDDSIQMTTNKELVEILKEGRGTIISKAKVELNKNKITISKVPAGILFNTMYKKLKDELDSGKIVASDLSTDTKYWEIEKVPRTSIDMIELKDKIEKILTLKQKVAMYWSEDDKCVQYGFYEVVEKTLEYLKNSSQKHFIKLYEKQLLLVSVLDVITKLKTKDKIKQLYSKTRVESSQFLQAEFNCTEEIANSVLNRSISYLTSDHDDEIAEAKVKIKEYERLSKDSTDHLISQYKKLLKKI